MSDSRGRVSREEAQPELPGCPADATIEAEEREPGHVGGCDHRARQMDSVESTQGFGRERSPRALDDFAVDPKEVPVRGRSIQ